MEFLLINHPLDCPICDQGGECELQDLAMGYGRSVSRFTERKRVVADEDVGPLIRTDMTRCIHCTRCVRFLEEIAGTSEMGGAGRGDRLEIGTCIETSIDSELSGNIIDLCPVGALTNRPYRYSARAWELASRPSHALHDGVGSSLWYHVRRGRVMRAVPRDAERLNETWLSDRDRYSHFGLYAEDRLLAPQIKQDGHWREASWDEALEAAGAMLRTAGADLGILMSPSVSDEEYFLARRLADGLGTDHIDHRLRETDFSDEHERPVVFQGSIEELEHADRILLVGCNVRQEAPILGHRVRKAWRAGAQVHAINPLDWDFHFELAGQRIAAPQHLARELAALCSALGEELPAGLEPVMAQDEHRAMAASLGQAERAVVLVGQAAMSHPRAALLRTLGARIAACTGGVLNLLSHGGNGSGALARGARPLGCGKNSARMIREPCPAYLLWDFEPDCDLEDPRRAMAALQGAKAVVAVTAFAGPGVRACADVLLPLAPWPESDGTITNLEGRRLAFKAAGRSQGQSRPGWKILRRLGSGLDLSGFDQVSLEEVRNQLETSEIARLRNLAEGDGPVPPGAVQDASLYRIGEVPLYSVDALCRRAQALQATVHAQEPWLGLHPEDAQALGLADGVQAEVSQGGDWVEMVVRCSRAIPQGGARVPCAVPQLAALGPAQGPVEVRAVSENSAAAAGDAPDDVLAKVGPDPGPGEAE
jgi:NADH-quinone oxidoreductase subunit G